MISEKGADAAERLSLLQDFEAVVVIPKLGKQTARTISTKFFLSGPIADVKQLCETVLFMARHGRQPKRKDSGA